jgi:hypothetical protein
MSSGHGLRILACGLTLAIAACLPAADAPVPRGYEDLVNGARTSLRQNQDGLIRPPLAFLELRCFANGGHVVVFQVGSDPAAIAFALQGPGAPVDGWGGGFGGMEEEVAFNFAGVAEVDCPSR